MITLHYLEVLQAYTKVVPMLEVLNSERTNMGESENLKAETGLNKEVGFRYINDNILGADRVGFSIKYFKTDIDDVIETSIPDIYNNGTLDYGRC